MRITAQEEFGLRILVRIAKSEEGLSINEISQLEGITKPNVAKLCRILRIAELVTSEKGHSGGYTIAKAPNEVTLKEVFNALDTPLYHGDFCGRYSGSNELCTHTVDCTVRSLWSVLQFRMDEILANLTLQDMLGDEANTKENICKSTGVEL